MHAGQVVDFTSTTGITNEIDPPSRRVGLCVFFCKGGKGRTYPIRASACVQPTQPQRMDFFPFLTNHTLPVPSILRAEMYNTDP